MSAQSCCLIRKNQPKSSEPLVRFLLSALAVCPFPRLEAQ